MDLKFKDTNLFYTDVETIIYINTSALQFFKYTR